TGIFATKSVNPAGADGLIHGNAPQLINQVIGVLAGWALAAAGTFIILKLVGFVTPLRVTQEEEIAGLDLALHGEVAYNVFGPGMSVGSGAHTHHDSHTSSSIIDDSAVAREMRSGD
ncbi:MAG TPA: hypothetical protein VKF81_03495, partial [Blastocatellia bacterium]|nr:hypothetical protein [Blastocatellia bacterium]